MYVFTVNFIVINSHRSFLFSVTERKLEKNEFPHSVYIRSYSALSTTSLAIRKWIFTLARVRTKSVLQLVLSGLLFFFLN